MDDSQVSAFIGALLVSGLVVAYCAVWWNLYAKSGRSGWWCVAMLIPFIGAVVFIIHTLTRWPVQDELERLQEQAESDATVIANLRRQMGESRAELREARQDLSQQRIVEQVADRLGQGQSVKVPASRRVFRSVRPASQQAKDDTPRRGLDYI